MAKRIEKHFPVLYRGISGNSAHEFIIDLRNLKTETGISDEDVAKRLIDYGFHAPTMSWPVPGTLMIEPTESESKEEMDRFCDAMIAIRKEIDEVVEGKININDNPLSNAPHTAIEVMSDNWEHGYSRERAAYPAGLKIINIGRPYLEWIMHMVIEILFAHALRLKLIQNNNVLDQ